jgi:hypothetical protein
METKSYALPFSPAGPVKKQQPKKIVILKVVRDAKGKLKLVAGNA